MRPDATEQAIAIAVEANRLVGLARAGCVPVEALSRLALAAEQHAAGLLARAPGRRPASSPAHEARP